MTSNFETHRPALARYARRLLDRALAHRIDLSGVVQQTFLEASRVATPAGRPTRYWLRTLLRRNYFDAVRRERAKRRDGRRDRTLNRTHAAAAESPSRVAINAERVEALLVGLETLAPDRREVVELRYLDGHGLDEIAARLDKSRAAVAGLLRRGLDDLRGRVVA